MLLMRKAKKSLKKYKQVPFTLTIREKNSREKHN